jgi:hypothetical protein
MRGGLIVAGNDTSRYKRAAACHGVYQGRSEPRQKAHSGVEARSSTLEVIVMF